MPHIPVQDASADAFWLMESFMAGTAGGCARYFCAAMLRPAGERAPQPVTLLAVITSSTIRNTITSVLSRKRSPALDVRLQFTRLYTNGSSSSSD